MSKKFTTQIRINFYDCDPAGILFFANLQKKAHLAYEIFLSKISNGSNYFNDDRLGLPIIKAESIFHSPMKSGEVIDVEVVVKVLKEKSFELGYHFRDGNSVRAEVSTVHVCVDKKTFKKTPLPDELYNHLKNYLIK